MKGIEEPWQMQSCDPSTSEVLGTVLKFDADKIGASLLRAREAQKAWAAVPIAQRAESLLDLKETIDSRRNEICEWISRETGKPVMESLSMELLPVANLLDYFARKGPGFLKTERFSLSVFRQKRSEVSWEPLGVVGIIAPWNFPFTIPMGQVAMAILAGNAVILKPSEHTPLVGQLIAELCRAAGIPEFLVQTATGGPETGAALVASGVDKIAFTGSVLTGRGIAVECARRWIPCLLELGGKDAMIVCEDAPFERAVRGAVWGAFANNGQTCAAVERLYVSRTIADRFIPAVVAEVQRLKPGMGKSLEFDLGSMAHEGQRTVVEEQIDDALKRGARALTGGRRREGSGFHYEPTVLVDVNSSMRIMKEETFGPVLPIQVVESDEEAIREANASSYGLLASVWTTNSKKGRRIAMQLEAGTILINDVLYTHGASETPWFGIKQSGQGIVHSRHGLREFVRPRHINWDLFPMQSNPWWFPYTAKKFKLISRLMDILHRWGLKKWV